MIRKTLRLRTAAPAQQDVPVTHIPVLVYGTAWKKEQTADLVYKAIRAGFRAIDTAAQPKHYREDLVGSGIRRAIREGIVRRDELYIQTKFTSVAGQDLSNMPYDPRASIPEQVQASIKSSLHHLRVSETGEGDDDTYIDTLVLHSPLPTLKDTIEAWTTVETYVPHRIRNVGVSNCPADVLEALYNSPQVRIKPAVVQNRFYADTGYDVAVRAFCRQHDMIFQSFWTLTANLRLLMSRLIADLADLAGISKAAALYALVLGLQNAVILDGTTNDTHMADDLQSLDRVNALIERNPDAWAAAMKEFRQLIGDP